MSKVLMSLMVLGCFILGACNKSPEGIAGLTAPIAYAFVKNAVAQEKINGSLKIDVKYQNLKMADGDWPFGEINFIVESSEYPGKKITVNYILDGTYNATALIEIPGKGKKQVKVNLAESCIVFGQTQNVENIVKSLAVKMSSKISQDKKIAVFDVVGINDENTVLGKRLSESLISHLADNNIKIVERKLLRQAFKEIELQNSGLTSNEVRSKIGQFLGAEAILVGTLKNEKDEILVNLRVVDLKSGVIISATQGIFPKYLIKSSDLNVIPQ